MTASRLSFTTFATPSWSIERVTSAARAAGYDEVELRFLDDSPLPPRPTEEWIERVRSSVRRDGLRIACLGSGARLAVDDPSELAGHVRDLMDLVGVARKVGARLVRFFGLGTLEPAEATAERMDRVVQALQAVLPLAETSDVRLVVETHDIFARGNAAAKLIARCESPALGVLWDYIHPLRRGESPEETFAAVGPHIAHVHMKDARRDERGSWRDAMPGTGEIDLNRIVGPVRDRALALSLEWEGGVDRAEDAIRSYPAIVRPLMS